MKNLTFLAKGKRSIVYSGVYKGKPCAVKVKREDSAAEGTIEREYEVLRLLNKHNIGPKVYAWDNGIVMELITGVRIREYLASATRAQILAVLSSILDELRTLDRLGYSKEEMVNPYKHIIVTKGGPRMIDFERCKKAKRPQNTTQFASFLRSANLAEKGAFIIPWRIDNLCRVYKHSQTGQNFKNLKDEILQKNLTARVYFAASKVPAGKVTSYQALARAAGTRAYRAVGQAMNKNPFWPIVPCHRVGNADGRLGGFATGLAKKRALLKEDGVKIIKGKIPIEYFFK